MKGARSKSSSGSTRKKTKTHQRVLEVAHHDDQTSPPRAAALVTEYPPGQKPPPEDVRREEPRRRLVQEVVEDVVPEHSTHGPAHLRVALAGLVLPPLDVPRRRHRLGVRLADPIRVRVVLVHVRFVPPVVDIVEEAVQDPCHPRSALLCRADGEGRRRGGGGVQVRSQKPGEGGQGMARAITLELREQPTARMKLTIFTPEL
ncbi:hypothetical protein THAOC_20877 [Thalassiosira oceanica]|uniref:Uncharacterized protein n=1 Tax=Thalassiosira oceanica TaxID=159749 RepID=K0SDD3_THAOC|nr:hypothetical protein THAOC_20877 [Thalassiosira oceanica]|eukprot:EJK58966.1 hypothetical protein THAOC_20877 [Thalassiosira oceanica]